MRALVQRVTHAEVTVEGEVMGTIETGLLVLLGVTHTDTPSDASFLARKVGRLRIFSDDAGKMNRSVQDVGGSVLVVSQFTLYADARRGNRPSYTQAAAPDQAEKLYEYFMACLRDDGLQVASGRFGTHMRVSLLNDGPVTLWLDSEALSLP
jgi:D-tyrosyl-tRNA(Tyr) deacylase